MTRSRLFEIARASLSSTTLWINVAAVAYVLLTGDIQNLQRFHLDDHTTAVVTTLINLLHVLQRKTKETA